ncbi:transporter [Paracoccus lichenicola]|nr:transporter [Paracoccus lichenicola]
MSRFSRTARAGCSALAIALAAAPGSGLAQDRQGCALTDGALPEGCSHANAGTVVARPAPANAAHEAAGDLGDLGFSISIDAALVASDAPDAADAAPRRTIAGAPAALDRLRAMDHDLDRLGLRVQVDGLGARPMLNLSTTDLRTAYPAGERVEFRSFSNYPAWIARAEVVVTDPEHPGRPLAVLPTRPNGVTAWTMPAQGPETLFYTLRVYDGDGRLDETAPLPLTRGAAGGPDLTGPVIAAGEAEDRTARRGIPVRGAVVTVSGEALPPNARLTVMGEEVLADADRRFVLQRIMPPGDHGLAIAMGGQSQIRSVTVPQREFFATGIAEVTLGRDLANDENWRFGRLSGFLQGVRADGTRLTASVDTRDTELRDIFGHATRRFPDQVLRQIEDRDVWTTTGDDSATEDLAPTSGRLFVRVEDDRSHAMWGDFRPEGDLDRMVRTDRTLYGASAGWQSRDVAVDGGPRRRIAAYAASTDRLSQRDVFRGTGGSAYFLSHRDIESGTETLLVEVRNPVTNTVVSSRRLVEGQDYRIDYVQGVVILNEPLQPSANGPGLVQDSALGDHVVNLVAQYDYVPASGGESGSNHGARAEAWATPALRLGSTLAQDGAGTADNRLAGVDLLWTGGADSWLSAEIAQSQGPGFGQTLSLTGGLDRDPQGPAARAEGQRARGMRVQARLDLADLGGEGHVAVLADRRDRGFSAPDWTVGAGQRSEELDGRVAIGGATALTLGGERFRDDEGRRDNRARLGIDRMLSAAWQLEAEVAQRDSAHPGSLVGGENGDSTDAALRLTWHRGDDLSVWAFGQANLSRSGDLLADNRLGLGAEAAITGNLRALAELSHGTQGLAGRAGLAWQADAASTYTLGWREDPTRIDDLSSGERRGLTFGAQRRINDDWAYTTETVQSGVTGRRSLASTYGVSYTPDARWRHDAGLVTGRTREHDGTVLRRTGFSLGTAFSDGEDRSARLRGEWRRERPDEPARLARRETWMVAGDFTWRASDDWRLVGELDSVISQGEEDLRDGRYVEARLGYAYRPVASDRLNALFSYTYLQDLPGADQVNIDGDADGPRQRSHILNAAVTYDLDQRWTLGVKYGYRMRRQAERDDSDFTRSRAHLGILRLDYRIVFRWDAMGEVRAFHAPQAGMTEYGALLGIYREITPHARLGLGYLWGGVSDDLRTVEKAKEGVFVNLIGKF